jgi:phage gpG-like protein
VFPGPGGRMIFAKKVVVPARPFMPLKKGYSVVTLPPAWSADITRAMRAYFKNAATKGTT